ncbi:hypothetical protein ACFOZ7_20520 [Natribaculum luteum]|uniref:Uncharacterized protein n=1 Tax=Natribaculum luteum TaxID=1586232 RepID=A0ABD5P564_9EURY|nr:hypothetical protein [Natribaculum luteum]
MLGIESFGATGQALTEVGVVLADAIVLYVVYGAVTSLLGGKIRQTVGGE